VINQRVTVIVCKFISLKYSSYQSLKCLKNFTCRIGEVLKDLELSLHLLNGLFSVKDVIGVEAVLHLYCEVDYGGYILNEFLISVGGQIEFGGKIRAIDSGVDAGDFASRVPTLLCLRFTFEQMALVEFFGAFLLFIGKYDVAFVGCGHQEILAQGSGA